MCDSDDKTDNWDVFKYNYTTDIQHLSNPVTSEILMY